MERANLKANHLGISILYSSYGATQIPQLASPTTESIPCAAVRPCLHCLTIAGLTGSPVGVRQIFSCAASTPWQGEFIHTKLREWMDKVHIGKQEPAPECWDEAVDVDVCVTSASCWYRELVRGTCSVPGNQAADTT